MDEGLLDVYWAKPLLNISWESGMSGIESKQKWAVQILANFLVSHHSVQEISWGKAEKWTVVAGARHWWGTNTTFNGCLVWVLPWKQDWKQGRSPRASSIYSSPIPSSNSMNSNYQDGSQVSFVVSNHLWPPLTGSNRVPWYLMAVSSFLQ